MFFVPTQFCILLQWQSIVAAPVGPIPHSFLHTHVQQGRIQDFKLGGAHLKKLRLAEGGANYFGVFCVKNHDFTPKNHIFFQF